LSADELAYIKPCTQGIQQTLVAKFCKTRGIPSRHVGPVVFFRGFTQKFLTGELPEESYPTAGAVTRLRAAGHEDVANPSDEDAISTSTAAGREATRDCYTALLRKRIDAAVAELVTEQTKVVIVDGVGYPAVGSICGVSNADTALICDAPVLIVGKPGLGDCIDSFEQARAFFHSRGARVLGLLVNRVRPGAEMEKTAYVREYFKLGSCSRGARLLGILPENEIFSKVDFDSYAPPGEHSSCAITFRPPRPDQLAVDALTEEEERICTALVENFRSHVSSDALLSILEAAGGRGGKSNSKGSRSSSGDEGGSGGRRTSRADENADACALQ